jgi:endonuclease-8
VLELASGIERRLGPDILAVPPQLDAMLRNLRAADPKLSLGEALQRQRLVSGIGNMWMAEALWKARLSPWAPLGALSDEQVRAALASAHALMRGALDGGRGRRRVYRHAGRPCPRCGTPIRSRGQGDDNRTAYWCPGCQAGGGPPGE